MYQLLVVLSWITVIGGVAWLAALALQFVDVVNSLSDLRSARDTPLRDGAARKHIHENTWSLAGAGALAIVLAFGVDVAVRAWVDWGNPLASIAIVFGLLVVASAGAFGVVALVIRGEGLSYAILRTNLIEEAGTKLSADEVKLFRNQLEQVDNRKRHIRFGLRDRAGLRPVRVRLASIADEFAAVPPTGFSALRPVRWRTANAYLWVGNPVRLVPAFLAFAVLVVLIIGSIVAGGFDASTILLLVLAAVATTGSFLLAVLQARAVLAAKAAWHAVYGKQRLEVLRLLEELERSSRKGVAGLGDRVARALQILRDQQNS